MDLLVNIDVPDLAQAVDFYTGAFGLTVTRRFGEDGAELGGWPAKVCLLEKAAGSLGAGDQARGYHRHWTPVHLDVVVDDLDRALVRGTPPAKAVLRALVW
jgi:catechol 2,3-dioxygenase-like lactoylglutathione lyase family enzyme